MFIVVHHEHEPQSFPETHNNNKHGNNTNPNPTTQIRICITTNPNRITTTKPQINPYNHTNHHHPNQNRIGPEKEGNRTGPDSKEEAEPEKEGNETDRIQRREGDRKKSAFFFGLILCTCAYCNSVFHRVTALGSGSFLDLRAPVSLDLGSCVCYSA
ncbi:transmembrane protein, putative [Medicago truncatula]|uniref:Transmembrane protein, putative n=1 Tax=Medicago truncatula TaxID=3880 RepID=G7IZ48_MEDTR|nr:transmembrane protein, putative [Medicago truncatula]